MKKYTVIHKDGSKEIINAKSAVNDAIAEGNIVIDEDFEVLNPILLTPECDGKFAVIKENEPAKFIKYHAGCELGYEIDDLLYKHPDINGFYIHGGLTFAKGDKDFCPELSKHFPDYWIFGFDTCHADDTAEYWTEERTWEETEKLLQATITYGE